MFKSTDGSWRVDRLLQMFFAMAIFLVATNYLAPVRAAALSLGVGVLKELLDGMSDRFGTPDIKDLFVHAIGIVIGILIYTYL